MTPRESVESSLTLADELAGRLETVDKQVQGAVIIALLAGWLYDLDHNLRESALSSVTRAARSMVNLEEDNASDPP